MLLACDVAGRSQSFDKIEFASMSRLNVWRKMRINKAHIIGGFLQTVRDYSHSVTFYKSRSPHEGYGEVGRAGVLVFRQKHLHAIE